MSYKILIVDDSATTRAVIKRTIKLAGVPAEQVHEAPNGRAALELLTQAPVDLVLADLNMPEMNGAEMTHQLRSNPATAGIPIVVISAEPNIQKLEALKADGINGYLRKPFTPEGVRNVISEVLGACHA